MTAAKNYSKPEAMPDIFKHKGGAHPTATHYCPGCGHGVVHKLIAEAIDDLGIQNRSVFISPVGCAVFAYYYFSVGNIQVPHGRAPAVGTGIARARDDAVVISYQGDGDLASIGLNETLQAANRGERLAVFFINNTVYGMTGGQMAPTTLAGEVTSTCINGRDTGETGYPMHMCELINQLKAPVYIERVSIADIGRIRKARSAIRKALQIQKEKKGYAFVEILSNCPTNLRQDAMSSVKFMKEQMEKEFPLGVIRDDTEKAASYPTKPVIWEKKAIDDIYELDTKGMIDTPDNEKIIPKTVKIAGFGGQGVLSMGLILANVAGHSGLHTSWYPSYGPEQRGGTANCMVVISGMPVASPVIYKSDILVALNQPSLEKFVSEIKDNGVVIYDDKVKNVEIPTNITAYPVPATELALQAGSEKMTNTIMLGILASLDMLELDVSAFEKAIKDNFSGKNKLVELNLSALNLAKVWAKNNLLKVYS